MKLLILSIIWFPLTIMVLLFSLTFLIRQSDYYQAKASGLNQSYSTYLFPQDNEPTTDNLSTSPNQDARLIVLKKFLSDYRSPLISVADVIIKQSDIYGIDYALIPAIAMQESGGCKVIPPNSYNCWGLGIYGNRKTYFNSYQEAITAVAKTIKERYVEKGLTNPTLLEDLWTPSSVGSWSYSVNFFIGKIREYERNYSSS